MPDKGLQHTIDLSLVYVPWAQCQTATTGDNPGTVMAAMRRRTYDQTPIVDGHGQPLGLAFKEGLEQMRLEGRLIELADGLIHRATIQQNSSLANVIQVMSETRAVLVTDGCAQQKRGPLLNVRGLLTISDLNKAPFLAAIFVILAEIETTLARLIEVHYSNPWEWIQKLSRQRQAEVLGYWELAKKQNVDAGPILSCYLGDLVTIGQRTEGLREVFAASSNADGSPADRIRRLRNAVMHPVAPLLRSREDVCSLGASLSYAVNVLAHMEKNPTSEKKQSKKPIVCNS